MNAKLHAARVLHLIHQAGPSGATAPEISEKAGLALQVVEAHLRALRRQGLICRAPATRTSSPSIWR